jgi:hypothetical protein
LRRTLSTQHAVSATAKDTPAEATNSASLPDASASGATSTMKNPASAANRLIGFVAVTNLCISAVTTSALVLLSKRDVH